MTTGRNPIVIASGLVALLNHQTGSFAQTATFQLTDTQLEAIQSRYGKSMIGWLETTLQRELDALDHAPASKFSQQSKQSAGPTGWKLDTDVIPPQRQLCLVQGKSGYRTTAEMPRKDTFVVLAYRDEAYRPGVWITVQDDRLTDSFPEGPYYWRELGDFLDG